MVIRMQRSSIQSLGFMKKEILEYYITQKQIAS